MFYCCCSLDYFSFLSTQLKMPHGEKLLYCLLHICQCNHYAFQIEAKVFLLNNF
jgi:hypothetical protein